MVPPINLWRATYSLDKSLGYLGFPMKPLWPASQLDVTQTWYWKLLSVTRDAQLGFCLCPDLSSILFILTSYLHTFQGASTVLGFHAKPQMALSLTVSPHIPFLTLLLPPSLHLVLLFPPPPYPHLSITVYSISIS